MARTRRYFCKALESERIGVALLLIRTALPVGQKTRGRAAPERLRLRQLESRPVLLKLRAYLQVIDTELAPKNPGAWAVRYTPKNWEAVTRYANDGDLETDHNCVPLAWLLIVLRPRRTATALATRTAGKRWHGFAVNHILERATGDKQQCRQRTNFQHPV